MKLLHYPGHSNWAWLFKSQLTLSSVFKKSSLKAFSTSNLKLRFESGQSQKQDYRIFSIKRRGHLFKTRPRKPGVYLNPAFIRGLAFTK